MNINNSLPSDRLELLYQAMQAVNGEHCVEQYLNKNSIRGDICLISIGKAACSMAKGAYNVLPDKISHNLIITKHAHATPELAEFNVIEAGHPVPDHASLEAGQQLLRLLDSLPATTHILFLISGGTSALVEVLPPGVSISELEKLNAWLLQSGWSISEMNALRSRISCIKGGRLAGYVARNKSTVLLMSDVQNDDPAVIGSGLLCAPDPNSGRINEEQLPTLIRNIIDKTPPMPTADDPCFQNIEYEIVANLKAAMSAASRAAVQQDYETVVHLDYLEGDAIASGKTIAQVIQNEPGKLHIWGGEVTVVLPPNPGQGGRCQSLSLSAAIELESATDWWLLAAGTDGGDGTMDAAGAYVDNNTLDNVRKALGSDLDATNILKQADAGSLFETSGNLIKTGPTGTNVADLVFAYLGQ